MPDPQRRADQVRAFQAELAELEQTLGTLLSPDSRAAVQQHHDTLLARLKAQYDVDTSAAEEQLSLGMRIASLLGTVALCAALFFFFYRFWGLLGTPAQLGLVSVVPVLGLVLTEFIARRERAGYFTGLAAAVTFAAFVLSLTVIGAVYNMPSSPVAFVVWGAFGLILAAAYGQPVVHLAGVVFLTLGACGLPLAVAGISWASFPLRPETLLLTGLCWAALPMLRPARNAVLGAVDQAAGVVLVVLAVTILGLAGRTSLLPLSIPAKELSYDLLGIALTAGGIWLGIRRSWNALRIASTLGLIWLMFVKAFDWLWELVPRYLFFLLIGGLAVAVLLLLRRTRTRSAI
jgi:uncharacterized membrane protein